MEKEITVIEARDLIQGENDLQLLDVRTEESFKNDSLPGFMNVPLNSISRTISDLDGRKRTLLICKDGSQSHEALKLLESVGFNAQVIRGGLKDWKKVINPALT